MKKYTIKAGSRIIYIHAETAGQAIKRAGVKLKQITKITSK